MAGGPVWGAIGQASAAAVGEVAGGRHGSPTRRGWLVAAGLAERADGDAVVAGGDGELPGLGTARGQCRG